MYNFLRVILALLTCIADVHCSHLDRDTELLFFHLTSPKNTWAISKHRKWKLFETS